ncbi:MAG: SRPBCC family protein [Gulosibacter sp.]|uniref:SRPBCC family protein n=1 Tax=Gulosibacter sp. TaxID=2817531 RepID=UPI003F8EB831
MAFEPSLDISVRFRASAEEVWSALTDEENASKWWPGYRIRIKNNAKGSFAIKSQSKSKGKHFSRISGAITKVIPGEEIRIALQSEPDNFRSELRIYVSQLKNKSRLRLVESGLPETSNSHRIVAESKDFWRDFLAALSDHLDK